MVALSCRPSLIRLGREIVLHRERMTVERVAVIVTRCPDTLHKSQEENSEDGKVWRAEG